MNRRDRHAVTLVEMLIVVTIIAILVSMVMFGLHSAEQSGKEAKTRTMIAAIDRIVMEKYDKFASRKLPIPGYQGKGHETETLAQFNARKDAAEKLLKKMELPDRWQDVTFDPTTDPLSPLERSALSRIYLAVHTAQNPTDQHAAAECLYLVVKHLSRGHQLPFKKTDIKDTDGDGAFEIVDAWGRPIYFLRDAPAFPSPIVDTGTENLWPVIYSGGPDKKFGVDIAAAGALRGRPFPADPTTHKDNVHNHLLFKQF